MRAEADVPVQLERAGADGRVVRERAACRRTASRRSASRRAGRCPRGSGRRRGCSRRCCRGRRRSRCRWRASASDRVVVERCCSRSSLVVRRRPHREAVVAGVADEVVRRPSSRSRRVWKLMPSAIWSAMTVLRDREVRTSVRRTRGRPSCGGCRGPSNVESLSAPPMPLTWSVSMRSRTSPSIAKSGQVHVACCRRRRRTCRRSRRRCAPSRPARACASVTSWPLTIVYQLPAPSIVTSSTTMWRLTWNVPGRDEDRLVLRSCAAAIAASKASAESRAPVGSAPKSARTLSGLGLACGGATCSESMRSMTVQAACVPAGAVSRTVSPRRVGLAEQQRAARRRSASAGTAS